MSLLMAVGLAACGGGGVNGPSDDDVPNVAGSYTGTLSINGAGAVVTCPASTTVTQSANQVGFTALTLSGQCTGLAFPMGNATLLPTGVLADSGTTLTGVDPSCGSYTASASITFAGRTMSLSVLGNFQLCGTVSMNGQLSR
jgi:hypothetical protein